MIAYLVNSSILLTLLFLVYHFLLSQETFYRANRWVLLCGIFLSFTLPLVKIPPSLALQMPVEIKEAAVTKDLKYTKSVVRTNPSETESAQKSKPIEVLNTIIPQETKQKQIKQTSPFSWLIQVDYLPLIYIAGLIVILIHFFLQIGRIVYLFSTGERKSDGSFQIVCHPQLSSIFSFLNLIFINQSEIDDHAYEEILTHEKIHVSEGHSLDMILAQLLVTLQWFNPFAWSYRKSIENNLEFIADQSMINRGAEPRTYQLNLLKLAVPQANLLVVNNYNQSFLKKRIVMMNKENSKFSAIWKYLLLIPVMCLTMSCLNAVAQESELQKVADEPQSPNKNLVFSPPSQPALAITPPVLDISFEKQETKQMKPVEPNVIPVAAQTEDGLSIQPVPSPPAISKVPTSGKWKAWNERNDICLSFTRKGFGHSWQWSDCHDEDRFEKLRSVVPGKPYRFTRDAGTIVMSGAWKGKKGKGEFNFEVSSDFKDFLIKNGVDEVDDELAITCFFNQVDRSYVVYLKQRGFGLSSGELNQLMAHDINQPEMENYLRQFDENGVPILDIASIVRLHIHDVEPNYIGRLKTAGVTELTVDEIVRFANHDVEPSDVQAYTNLGMKNMTPDDIIRMSQHDVDQEYAEEFTKLKLGEIDVDDLIRFSMHDVSPEIIVALQDMGLGRLTSDDIIRASMHDIDVDYISEIKASGANNLSMDDLIRFSSHDVDPDLIKSLVSAGIPQVSNDDIIRASSHDVDIDFIDEIGKSNEQLTMDDIIRFVSHDIDADYINSWNEFNLSDLSNDLIISASNHDVDIDEAREIVELGIKGVTMQELINTSMYDIDGDDIRRVMETGVKGKSLREYRDIINRNDY